MTSPAGSPSSHLRGILLIMAAVSTFAVLDTIAKYLSRTYPVPLIVWARYAFHTLFMVFVLGQTVGMGLVRTRRPALQLFRGLVLVVSSLLFFSAISLMPLAEASAITFVSPLLLTAMSVWILKERVRRSAWLAVGIGFVGVLIIVRPGGAVFTPAAALPLLTAACFALYQLLTRKLAGVDSTITTLFLGAIVGTVVMSLLVPLFWKAPENAWHALLFLATGALGAGGHFVLIRAFEYAPASVLAPFVYAQLVTVLILGYLVFGAFPDGPSLVGMAIIVASGAWIATHQTRLAPKQA
jgi:drug/metabolite transporter (DMT)-like permease